MTQKIWISLFLFILLTRGLLQLLMPTPAAMALHLFLVALFTFTFLWQGRGEFSTRLFPVLFWSSAFLVCVAISAAFTTYYGGITWFTYVGFTIYSVASGLVLAKLGITSNEEIPFAKILLSMGWLLFIVALLEQFYLFKMPGASRLAIFVRPASVTGSMLHYPIILALIAFCLFQWYAITRQKTYLFCGLLFCFAQVTALSRSGMLIVAAGYGLVMLQRIVKYPQTILKAGVLLVIVMIILGAALSSDSESLPHKIATRILTAADPHAPGNADRIRKWFISASRWSDTHWMFGELTGLATNSSVRFSSGNAFITESGFFQQLLNFGLLGVICYYGLFISLGLLIHKEHLFLRAVFFASLLETFVYQSVEVVSFMTLLSMLPWISRTFSLHKIRFLHYRETC